MFAINPHKRDAQQIYLWFTLGSSFWFTLSFGVFAIFSVQTVGLTPLQLVLAGTALELSIFICEIPTGVIADVYSRRLSIVIGYFLTGIAFLLPAVVPTFAGILLFNVIWGIGHTFTSGATDAWITDEIGQDKIGPLFMRIARLGSLIGVAANIAAIVLGSILITLPLVITGFAFIGLTIMMILYMPETGFHPTPVEERSTFGQMADTLRAGVKLVRLRPTLLALLGIGLFFGLFSEGLDRLGEAHILRSFTLPDFGGLQPVAWMGILGLIGGLLVAAAARVMEKRVDMTRSRTLSRASFGLTALLVASLFGFALAGNFVMVIIMNWSIGIFRSLIGPINAAWINQHIDSQVRATVISMTSQVDAFGQIVGGPPVGFIGERLGIRAALLASAFILSPVLYLYARIVRADRHSVGAALPAEPSAGA